MKQRKDNIAVTVASEAGEIPPPALRRMYDWTVETWQKLGLPVEEVGVRSSSLNTKGYKSYKRLQKRLEALDFGELQGIEFRYCRPEVTMAGLNWEQFSWTTREGFTSEEKGASRDRLWDAFWSVDHADAGITEERAVALAMEFAKRVVTAYGYLFFMRHWFGPDSYLLGATVHGRSERTAHEGENNSAWRWSRHERREKNIYLLRNVYPINFLSRPYLDLPIGGRTLEETIRSDARYGQLEPLNEHAMAWRPVVEHIPALREELFRTGVIFYRGFFVPEDPFYRQDYSRPFVCPEPIPEFLRADFVDRRSRDARLTY